MNISIRFKVLWDSINEPPFNEKGQGKSFRACIHSGNAGDIIYSLPTVKELGANHYVINLCSDPAFGGRNTDFKTARSFAPLLLSQPYIDRVTIVSSNLPLEYLSEPVEGIEFNLDKFRLQDVFKHHLAISHAKAFGLYLNLYKNWLYIDGDKPDRDYIVVSLTPRYRSLPKEYWLEALAGLDNIIVLGIPEEFHCVSGITADFVTCDDFLQMAKIIQGGKIFIGNPNLAYAIAEGLKVQRIVELPKEPQNAYPIGRSGYAAPPTVKEARELISSLLSGSEIVRHFENVSLCREIACLELQIREKDSEVDRLQSIIVQANSEIDELKNNVHQRDLKISDIEKTIQKLEQKLHQHETLFSHQGREMARLKAIENSLIWRIIRRVLDFVDKKLFPWHTRRGRLYLTILDRLRYAKKVDSVYIASEPKYHIEEDIPLSEVVHLEFPHFDRPVVSIIIPVFNKWRYTYHCLKSILDNTANNIPYEIVIANDASTDETLQILSKVNGIKVITNKNNLGFLRNCNNTARQVKGKYIFFLNNDTNVQKDWLRYLVDLIESNEHIGMVGSKLVYQNGKLQEAGGIIWKDASGWNYGRNDDPDKPEYNYVKEVDYISGASIMIRKDLWEKIAGFDERYQQAYFEDTDLAFEVRRHGYKVVYQPKSVIVHFEGKSHGTDIYSGIKSYQIKNRGKFIKKWKDVLEKEHFNNGEHVFHARDRSRNKKTILVIDHYVPQYDKDAGSRTIYQYLKLFIELGLNVKFLGDNFVKHEPYTTELEQKGIEVLYGIWYRDHWKEWIKKNANYIDYIFLSRPHISIKYIDYLKKYTKAKVIYYGHDLHYLRNLRRYEVEKHEDNLKASQEWKKIEFEIFKKADVIYYPSEIEIEEIKKYFPSLNARVIPAYIFDTFDREYFNPFEVRQDLLFVGGFSHPPNIDAVLWFSKEIFPKLIQNYPFIKFNVIGSNPPPEIIALRSENIIITGYVSDDELEKFYQQSRIVVAPLRYGAGLKGKIIEAMYHGIPVITTSIGAEGIHDEEEILLIEDNAEEFATKLIELYKNRELWEKLSQNSVKFIKNHFSKQKAKECILETLEKN